MLPPGFIRLFFGFFFTVLGSNLFALVPYYLELRGASELLYGAAAGMTGLGGVVAMALLGGRADRMTRRSAILRYIGVAWIGSLLALGALDGPPEWYLVVCALEGVMVGVGLPVVFVWASELGPPERRTQAFAWLGIAGLIGDSLGPLLGESLLLTQADPSHPRSFGVVFLAANVLWPLSIACFSMAPDARPPGGADSHAGLAPLLRIRELRTMLLATAAFGGALGVMVSLGKNFVSSIGLGFVSVLLGGHTIGALTSRLALPWLMRRFDRTRLVPIAFAGVAASSVLLSVTDGYGLLGIAGVVYGLSHGLLFPTLLARLIDFGGAQAAGRISTLYMGTFGLGMGLWPALGGIVLRVAGFPTLFLMLAAVCLGGLALTRAAEEMHRQPQRART